MIIIAHRSGPEVYPEQTVESAKDAMRKNADYIEIDLRFSSDSKIIVCHDSNAGRVFGVDKEVSDMTADEFCQLKHKNNPDYCGHTLKDYIDAGVQPLLLHIKVGNEYLSDIIEYLEKNGYLDKVCFGVTNPEGVRIVRSYSQNIHVLAFIKNKTMIDDCIDNGADFIRLWESWTDVESIDYIHSRNKKVWIMVGNTNGYEVGYTSNEFIESMVKAEVDGLLVNEPEKIRVLLQQIG